MMLLYDVSEGFKSRICCWTSSSSSPIFIQDHLLLETHMCMCEQETLYVRDFHMTDVYEPDNIST